MKYVIEIFENGVRTDVLVTNDEYDWDRFDKMFSYKLDSYLNKGYKIVSESSSSECSYNLLFNDGEMKSTVIAAKFHTESDFIDAYGQPIILSKLYRSEDSGDRYSINKSPWPYKVGLYLRNEDKVESHVETVNGHTQMSRTVGDRYDFDQKFIDSLKLYKDKDKND